jgi:iron complex outermembrane receptor protein
MMAPLAIYASVAGAQAVTHFNLPNQALSESLKAVGAQTNTNIMAPPQLVDAIRAPAINGAMTTREVLAKLLDSTKLEYYFVNDRTVVIRKQSAADATQTTGAVMGSDEVEEVVVRGVQFRYEDDVSSASKMPLAVKDTPQTVKVVTHDLIEFAGMRKFDDFYKVDASTAPSHTGNQYSRNYFRGFESFGSNSMKVDGFRTTGLVQFDLAPFERFEVVKGSTSTLYGQNAIGGTFNAISKMPQKQFGGSGAVEVGSFDHYRADLDFYGPLTADGDLSYRLVAARLDEQSYLDFVYDRRTVLAPTLKYEFSEDTSLTTRVYYQQSDFSSYNGFGTQFIGTDASDPAQQISSNYRVPRVSESRTGNSPWNDSNKEALVAGTQLEHRFGSWMLRSNLQYTDIDTVSPGALVLGTDRDGFSDSVVYVYDADGNTYAGEVNLFGDVELFGRRHTLFFGADYAKENLDSVTSSNYLPGRTSGFSILTPNYDLLRAPDPAVGYDTIYKSAAENKSSGLTAQVLLRPLDDLTVSLGTRYSHDVQLNRAACCSAGDTLGATQELKANEWTYQTGVTYAVLPSLNVYASYGTTFTPQSGLGTSGQAIAPEKGTAREIGLKGDAPGRKLSYSVAIFEMERSNISQSIPGSPFLSLIGVQSSKGVELDLQGELLQGWELYTSMAWMKAEYTEGEFKGIQPPNAPRFGASVFTSYEIQGGALRGLGFGGGVVHKRGRDTADLNRGIPIDLLGDITEVDVRAFYSLAQWQLDLSVSNLLDERYYSTPFGRLNFGYQINPARQVKAAVRYRF